MWLIVGSSVLMTLITIAFATPWFLVACIPMGAIYYAVMVYFIPTVRELKRLDATSRSPVFSAFSEALDGTTTIRAFRAEARFTNEVTNRLRSNLRAYFLGTTANRWLAVRLETLGTLITGASAFLAVTSRPRPRIPFAHDCLSSYLTVGRRAYSALSRGFGSYLRSQCHAVAELVDPHERRLRKQQRRR